MTKFLILIILVGLAVVGGAYLILSQSYPVALVNGKPIAAKDFNADYRAALVYYKNALELYNKDSAILEAEEAKVEIKRATLSNLIEDVLIGEELGKELDSAELQRIVDKKIEAATAGQEIQKAAETLYGLSLEKFRERVLTPQAKKEIFQDRLFLQNRDFNQELSEIKSKAEIRLFVPGFEWNGKEVIIKQ